MRIAASKKKLPPEKQLLKALTGLQVFGLGMSHYYVWVCH